MIIISAMARKRSLKVSLVKEKLITRIQAGYYLPGDRFFSNRGVAQHFGISYQTAHRLLRELHGEQWLLRRPCSGSYISGKVQTFEAAALCLNDRGKRRSSFGERLSTLLTHRLAREKIPYKILWGDRQPPPPESIPVIWECPKTLERMARARHFSVLFNDQPPPGVARSFIDSVAVDDYSGGVSAAELIAARTSPRERIAVLAGPSGDHRNRDRVAGFTSVLKRAVLVDAESWDFEAGYAAASALLDSRPRAVFCCNDRLASAVVHFARDEGEPLPAIVGFDNAPVSENLNITTIAIPWEQLIDWIVSVIKRRIGGERSNSIQTTMNPLPIIRDPFFR